MHLIFASMQRWQCLAFYLPPLVLAVVLLYFAEREGREHEKAGAESPRKDQP